MCLFNLLWDAVALNLLSSAFKCFWFYFTIAASGRFKGMKILSVSSVHSNLFCFHANLLIYKMLFCQKYKHHQKCVETLKEFWLAVCHMTHLNYMCPGAVWECESWTRPGCLGEVPRRHVRVHQPRPASIRPRRPPIRWTLSSRSISPPPPARLRPPSAATERGKEREPMEIQSHSVSFTSTFTSSAVVRFFLCVFIIFSALMTRRPIGRIPVTPAPPPRRKGLPLRTRFLPPIRFLTPRPTFERSPARVPSLPYPNPSRPGRLLPPCPPAGPFTPLLRSFLPPAL